MDLIPIALYGGKHLALVNTGAGRLRLVDVHASDRFVTEWLED